MKKPKIILNHEKNKLELNSKGERIQFSCCDCRLTHDVAVAIEKNGNIGLAFKRNEKQTQLNRKSWKNS